jgi:hypothetical protein
MRWGWQQGGEQYAAKSSGKKTVRTLGQIQIRSIVLILTKGLNF